MLETAIGLRSCYIDYISCQAFYSDLYQCLRLRAALGLRSYCTCKVYIIYLKIPNYIPKKNSQ